MFGEPLLAKQYVQFKLAELNAEIDLLRTYNRSIAEAYQAGRALTRQATIAKLTAGRLARRVADECLQFHGGIGYVEETWTASSATTVSPASAEAPTRSCCRCSPAWTA